jgi:predicted metal-dependent peptidase
MEKAMDTAKAAGAQNLDKIEELLNTVYKTEVNWKAILAQFLGNACDVLKEQTRKRRNRRYGIHQPGDRIYPKLNLFIGIDTSGSIGQREKEAFFNQINNIVDDRFDITLGDCDTQLQNIRKYNKVIPDPKLSGGGGTAYEPFFDYAKANKIDAMIILGDGYCFDTQNLVKPNGMPVLWAITEGGQFPVDWGYKLTISLPKE